MENKLTWHLQQLGAYTQNDNSKDLWSLDLMHAEDGIISESFGTYDEMMLELTSRSIDEHEPISISFSSLKFLKYNETKNTL